MTHPSDAAALSARWARRLLLPLACIGLSLAASAAHALSASATLDWSAFDISVVDTDANDGINASYSLEAPSSRTLRCLNGSADCPSLGFNAEDWTSQGTDAQSLGAMSGVASYSPHTLSAETAGRSPGGERSMAASRSALLMLEGASTVTITVPYTLSVDATGADPTHGSFAYAGLIVSSVGLANAELATPNGGTASSTHLLRLQWTNPSDRAVSYLNADAYARLYCVPSVPEPAPFALMAGGALLLLAARRRARGAARSENGRTPTRP